MNPRDYRIANIAIIDVVVSVVGMEYIGQRMGYQPGLGALLAIPLGIVVHKTLGIKTELNKKLGLN